MREEGKWRERGEKEKRERESKRSKGRRGREETGKRGKGESNRKRKEREGEVDNITSLPYLPPSLPYMTAEQNTVKREGERRERETFPSTLFHLLLPHLLPSFLSLLKWQQLLMIV